MQGCFSDLKNKKNKNSNMLDYLKSMDVTATGDGEVQKEARRQTDFTQVWDEI